MFQVSRFEYVCSTGKKTRRNFRILNIEIPVSELISESRKLAYRDFEIRISNLIYSLYLYFYVYNFNKLRNSET